MIGSPTDLPTPPPPGPLVPRSVTFEFGRGTSRSSVLSRGFSLSLSLRSGSSGRKMRKTKSYRKEVWLGVIDVSWGASTGPSQFFRVSRDHRNEVRKGRPPAPEAVFSEEQLEVRSPVLRVSRGAFPAGPGSKKPRRSDLTHVTPARLLKSVQSVQVNQCRDISSSITAHPPIGHTHLCVFPQAQTDDRCESPHC